MFSDHYALYVISAYVSTALILGAVIWSSVAAGRRAKVELEEAERLGGRR
ncbi:MAG: heme exporter protein CcmD [Pseudomonadota bacterium]